MTLQTISALTALLGGLLLLAPNIAAVLKERRP